MLSLQYFVVCPDSKISSFFFRHKCHHAQGKDSTHSSLGAKVRGKFPLVCRPGLELHLMLHSKTKFVDGQNESVMDKDIQRGQQNRDGMRDIF